MKKKDVHFEFEVKDYPIEKALAKFIESARKFFFVWPKDNILRMIKLVEFVVWSFITYDLIRSFLSWR